MIKLEVMHPAEEVPYASHVLGLVTLTLDGTPTLRTTTDAFKYFKEFMQQIKFRIGDRIIHNRRSFVIVDFDHEAYICTGGVRVPFGEAE